jgi:hypothetical protein
MMKRKAKGNLSCAYARVCGKKVDQILMNIMESAFGRPAQSPRQRKRENKSGPFRLT